MAHITRRRSSSKAADCWHGYGQATLSTSTKRPQGTLGPLGSVCRVKERGVLPLFHVIQTVARRQGKLSRVGFCLPKLVPCYKVPGCLVDSGLLPVPCCGKSDKEFRHHAL